jgi:hypothetical protein
MINKQNNNFDNPGKVNLARYETDVEGVSMKTLEAGLWWTKNRKNLHTILVILLLLISIISWGYTIYGFGYYLLIGMNADERMIKDLAQSTVASQNYLNQAAAKNLVLSPVGYLTNESNYDIYETITNPNAKWWAVFDYCFKKGNGEKVCGREFILPGEKKYIIALAKTFSSSPSDLTFSLSGLVWNKINNHVIADWGVYRNDRLNLPVTNQLFTPAASNAASEKIALNSLTFTITNNTAYGYWEVPLTIILTDASRIVYLGSYTISDFSSHDSRDVKLTWPGITGNVNGISIIPNLNILDQGVYQKPQ